MSYGLTQFYFYLPPDSGDFPALTQPKLVLDSTTPEVWKVAWANTLAKKRTYQKIVYCEIRTRVLRPRDEHANHYSTRRAIAVKVL
jgi:hypothetical protein